MTFVASATRLFADADRMTFPALLVDDNLCAQRFICDVLCIGLVTGGTGIKTGLGLVGVVVAGLAVNPGRFEIVRMRSLQLLRINLMMAVRACNSALLDVRLMLEHDLADRGREDLVRRRVLRKRSAAGDEARNADYQTRGKTVFSHRCLDVLMGK